MESGEEFEKKRLHGAGYFARLLERIEVADSVVELLQLSRSSLKMFQTMERRLAPALIANTQLRARSNGNQATLAVARKLVAYLMAVDKAQRPFVARKAEA